MIIEDTIGEITGFINKFRNTIRALTCAPKKLMTRLQDEGGDNLLTAPVFFLIAYFSFLCVHLSNDKGKGVGDRLGYDQLVVNLKELPDHLTEVERFLYLSLIFVLIYYANALVSMLLADKRNRKAVRSLLLYYVSLNTLLFVLLEILQLIIGDKLAAIAYNARVLGTTGLNIGLLIISRVFWILKYAAVPVLFLLAVRESLHWKKVLRYVVTLLFIIFSPDLIIWLNEGIAALVDPKSEAVLLKGSIIGPSSDFMSYGDVAPVLSTDSATRMSRFTFDLYVYNHSDSLLVVPIGDTLCLRTETQHDFDHLHTRLSLSEKVWDDFHGTPYVFYAAGFESKSDRYQVIQPGEVKWINFSRICKTKAEADLFRAFFCGCAKLSRLKVYRPSINTRVSSQIWVSSPVTQELVFSALATRPR